MTIRVVPKETSKEQLEEAQKIAAKKHEGRLRKSADDDDSNWADEMDKADAESINSADTFANGSDTPSSSSGTQDRHSNPATTKGPLFLLDSKHEKIEVKSHGYFVHVSDFENLRSSFLKDGSFADLKLFKIDLAPGKIVDWANKISLSVDEKMAIIKPAINSETDKPIVVGTRVNKDDGKQFVRTTPLFLCGIKDSDLCSKGQIKAIIRAFEREYGPQKKPGFSVKEDDFFD